MQARGTVEDDALIRRGTVIEGLPADPNPPVIDPGQTFSVDVPAASGALVGQIAASDAEGVIVEFAITSGDPGGVTPYFAVSSTGDVTLTTAGADSLRDGPVTLGVTATDDAGNVGTGSVTISVSYSFECEGGALWLGYADMVSGDRANLCVAFPSGGSTASRNTNVFGNPDVLTGCPAATAFVEPYFRNTSGNPAYGAVRFETSYRPRRAPGSNVTSGAPAQKYYCSSTACVSSTFQSQTSFNDSTTYVDNVSVCTLAMDGYALPTSGGTDSTRLSHIQYGSSTKALYNWRMGGVRNTLQTMNVSHYRVFRGRNSASGTTHSANSGYSFLQLD